MAIAKEIKYPVWIGEWSLATDVCAMWLGGFNDNSFKYVQSCNWVDCPKSYLPEDVAVDFDRTAAELGPTGNNLSSSPKYGKCPSDSTYWKDKDIMQLGQCILEAFNENVDAQFMWTFRTELEPRWEYSASYDKGWIK